MAEQQAPPTHTPALLRRKSSRLSAQTECQIKIKNCLPDLEALDEGTSRPAKLPHHGSARAGPGEYTGPAVQGKRCAYKPKAARIRPINVALLEEPNKRFKSSPSTTRSRKTSQQKPSTSKAEPMDQYLPSDSDTNSSTDAEDRASSSRRETTLNARSSTDKAADSIDSRGRCKRSRRKIPQNTTVTPATLPNLEARYERPKLSTVGDGLAKSLNKGLWEDLFMITTTFARSERTSFKDFLHFCQKKKVMEIFRGISGLNNLLELTETAISRCKDMWLDNIPLKRQVAWFYLLCVFVVYQPQALIEYDQRIVRIRVVESDWVAIEEFLLSAARSRTFDDVDSLFKLMYRKGAFLHCFTPLTHGLENAYVQSFVRDDEKTRFLFSDVPFPRLSCSLQPQRHQLDKAVKEYCEMKESLLELCSSESAGILSGLLTNVTPTFSNDLFVPLSSRNEKNP